MDQEHSSVETFADSLEIDPLIIIEAEKNPSILTSDILLKIARTYSVSIDDIVKNYSIDVESDGEWNHLSTDLNEARNAWLEQMNMQFTHFFKKPCIALAGLSDAGKSTMINTLIGQEILPAGLTPITASAVIIKHIQERPDFIENCVVVLKKDDTGSMELSTAFLGEITYLKRHIMDSGGYDLLDVYGVRQKKESNHGPNDMEDVSAIIVYVDSPILLNCDLMDLPGVGTGDRLEDDTITKAGLFHADIFVYLSLCNGFLRGDEIQFVGEAINIVSMAGFDESDQYALDNILLVASRANKMHKNINDLTNLLDNGAKRLHKVLSSDLSVKDNGVIPNDQSILRSRLFYYAKDTQTMRRPFEEALGQAISAYQKRLCKELLTLSGRLAFEKKRLLKGLIQSYKDIYVNFQDKVLEQYFIDLLSIESGGVRFSHLEGICHLDLTGGSNGRLSTLEDLYLFPNLRELKIGFNNIEDITPIGQLKKLEKLILVENVRLRDLSGLEGLENLRYLDVSRNNIRSLEVINTLPELDYLDASYNNLTDFILTEKLPKLTTLKLGHNLIEKIEELEHAPTLEHLFLNDNKAVCIDVPRTIELKSLYISIVGNSGRLIINSLQYFALEEKNFYLDPVAIEDPCLRKMLSEVLYDKAGYDILKRDVEAIEQIQVLPKERSFVCISYKGEVLGQSKFSEDMCIKSLQGLEYFQSLSSLRLPGQSIQNLDSVPKIENLRYLDLSQNKLKDIENLKGTKLIELLLDDNEIEDVSVLSTLAEIEHLSIKNNKIFDINPLACLTKLRVLLASDNPFVDTSGLKMIYKHLAEKDFKYIHVEEAVLKAKVKHIYFDDYPNWIQDNLIMRYSGYQGKMVTVQCLYAEGFGPNVCFNMASGFSLDPNNIPEFLSGLVESHPFLMKGCHLLVGRTQGNYPYQSGLYINSRNVVTKSIEFLGDLETKYCGITDVNVIKAESGLFVKYARLCIHGGMKLDLDVIAEKERPRFIAFLVELIIYLEMFIE
jgi:Leucine-rich repeat (LRR) protein